MLFLFKFINSFNITNYLAFLKSSSTVTNCLGPGPSKYNESPSESGPQLFPTFSASTTSHKPLTTPPLLKLSFK